jgi:hypothetical protein
MGKLLIVSPRFPPTNAADMHRVRLSLAYYRAHGWEPTVLSVDPATADGVDDPILAQSLPADIPTVRVRAWSERKCRWLGFGQLGYRCLVPLYRAGTKLLRRGDYDVVFFSSTVFLTFALGPLWKWRYRCAVVYDFQDPWFSPIPLYTPQTVPGRWWKYRIDQWLARHLEKFAMRAADHIVTVSEAYVEDLSRRYRQLDAGKFTVLPFGGSAADHEFARARNISQTVFSRGDAVVHWVYAGAVVVDMAPVLAVLFETLARLRQQDRQFAARLRLHFVGTNYAAAARTYKIVEPLAVAAGVADMVDEISERLPYFEAISLYRDSDAILLIGSIHADYTASKLLTCILAKKPVLALFHRNSLVASIAAQFDNVFLASFAETPAEADFNRQVREGLAWLRAPNFDPATIDDRSQPWSAAELARRQCAIFDNVAPAVVPRDVARRMFGPAQR